MDLFQVRCHLCLQFACNGSPAALEGINLTNVTSLSGRWAGSGTILSSIIAYNGSSIVGQLDNFIGGVASVPLTTSPTTITKIEVTRDSKAGWNYIEVNGKLLIDSDSPLAVAYNNNLFQTWTQWNNVSLMLATNPAHVARFNTIKAAMEAFPAERTAFRDSILTAIASSQLSADQETYLLNVLSE